METWVEGVAAAALEEFVSRTATIGLANTNEFVFRLFFMDALHKAHPAAMMETEWQRFDLLVRLNDRRYLVEFKYYICRRTIGLDGAAGQRKGGAGTQNASEFWACVDKLRDCSHTPVHGKYLVLVYERFQPAMGQRTFEESYGDLKACGRLTEVAVMNRESLVCKLLEIPPNAHALS
jgi:hypothetical protein